jgi:hypothetical protein
LKNNELHAEQSPVALYLFTFSFMLVFMIAFSGILRSDWALIFKKSLYHHDESVHSVVSANLMRQIFPAMVRVNPLFEEYELVLQNGRWKGKWMEGPHWQHIPPLFTYVPLPFFKLDKQVTIEVKRLSYAFVMVLTGLIFIFTVYCFEKTITGVISATSAAILWAYTRFSRDLLCGVTFGASDIVLAFTVICSFSIFCWYLSKPIELRRNYSYIRLIFMAAVVSLPILVKNVLGAIPAASFFVLFLYDHRKINVKLIVSFLSFLACLLFYYGSLYISSPKTFLSEIFIGFETFFLNYEGWARPWHFFITYYLPEYYLKDLWYPFVIVILSATFVLIAGGFKGRSRIILSLSVIWFLWNLLAVSLTKSKSPNLIYQTYLLSLFFGVHSLLVIAGQYVALNPIKSKLKKVFVPKFSIGFTVCLFVVLVFFSTKTYGGLINKIAETRSLKYNYESPRERFYQFGEVAQKNGANTKHIFILDTSEEDFWFRYYIMFLTGAEARTIDEIAPKGVDLNLLKRKYNYVNFVFSKSRDIPDVFANYRDRSFPNFTVISFDINSTDFCRLHEDLSMQIMQRISDDSNVFDLYEFKDNHSYVKVIAPQVYDKVDERYNGLLSKYKEEYVIHEKASFIDYDCKKVAPEEYKFYFLFKTKGGFEKTWSIYLLGFVEDEHLLLLSEKRQKYKSEMWWIEPDPPTLSWPANEYVMVAKVLKAKAIAYNMKLGFFRHGEGGAAKHVGLGWVDLAAPTKRPVYEFNLPATPKTDDK